MKPTRLIRTGGKVRLATYLIALWKLFNHPQTPRSAKWVAIAVLAYAVSPIDLIPDFIPILGQLDDIVLVPLGIALAVRLTPKPLWEARLREAETSVQKLPNLWWGTAFIVIVWAVLIGLVVWWLVSVL
ncbi:YkvA family protein [Piscinibacter sp.]|uniref:YkvA family protein n=1 Tax=Piscinibacter sp. TaxID=1903157 RepID=UPI002CC0FAA4|nr:YkvA family protein [Albitalea sp.]HUG23568.1 YkvA family protein [Albitalea sp.]